MNNELEEKIAELKDRLAEEAIVRVDEANKIFKGQKPPGVYELLVLQIENIASYLIKECDYLEALELLEKQREEKIAVLSDDQSLPESPKWSVFYIYKEAQKDMTTPVNGEVWKKVRA